jgi:Fe(3+) dicitrate transport protein
MMKRLCVVVIVLFGWICESNASSDYACSDTIPQIQLSGVEIVTERTVLPVHRLPNVYGVILTAGKKNEVIELAKSNADLASVNQRQIFARVPGLMIWESDGSGIQIGISARGLSPNRSWEFNTRQNGYDITPDVFGYPEAYYTPPMEAVERIEFIRGASSLQFGPQFGSSNFRSTLRSSIVPTFCCLKGRIED